MANTTTQIQQLLTRNIEDIFVEKHLAERLRKGDKLRIKFGIDPTGPNIHIGRAVPLWKLREFQDLGHQLVIIIGDFTAQIGDPSDKLSKRPMLAVSQIKQNLKTYQAQLGKILDIKKVEWRYNSEWLGKMNLTQVAHWAESFSVQQMLARRNFKDRWRAGNEISVRELLYPLMQGYDSVAVKADVELGGVDQLFNLQAGRVIQPLYEQPAQDIMTTQMLAGTDGRKMSTSWGNVITIMDEPEVMYGQAMSIKDELIPQYLLLATRLDQNNLNKITAALSQGGNPRDIKTQLAYELVKLYHGSKLAKQAQAEFELVHKKNQLPTNIRKKKLSTTPQNWSVVELLVYLEMAPSKAAARRLIEQKGIKINKITITDWQRKIAVTSGTVIQVGNRQFVKIV
ncbi:MAG: tyrosine--tRNA ligase [Patescibacteria group bacterium]